MKRDSHLVLAALVALSFGLSAVLLAGAVRAWGAAPALRILAATATHARARHAHGCGCSIESSMPKHQAERRGVGA